MSDPEIIALREVIAKRERSDDIAQRRRDYRRAGLAEQAAVRRHGGIGHCQWCEVGMDLYAGRRSWQGGACFCTAAATSLARWTAIGILSPRSAVLRGRARSPIDYRLAPEHPFPAAVDDALAAYRFLLANGVQPNGIIIAGDSAGGGLVVAAMLALALPDCRSLRAAGRSHRGSTWRRSATA